MDGVELAARFSYITNTLRFCGPEKASEEFVKYIEKKENLKEVEELIKKFEGLWPYLSSIAEKNNKKEFDFDVVEAYWIGNKLLDVFKDDDNKKIIDKLMERGLPKSIGENSKKNLIPGLVPHHNFNVMFVGVGQITQTVETNLQNMDNCRTSWGKVIEIMDQNLLVNTKCLKYDKKYYLGEEETKTVVYLPLMLPNIKVNDIVAIHWGFAPLILEDYQIKDLEKYTNKIIEVINSV